LGSIEQMTVFPDGVVELGRTIASQPVMYGVIKIICVKQIQAYRFIPGNGIIQSLIKTGECLGLMTNGRIWSYLLIQLYAIFVVV